MKKNGFVSTTIIYTFFSVFLLLLVFLLEQYSNVRFLLDEYKDEIKTDFIMGDLKDINLFIYVIEEEGADPIQVDTAPVGNYRLTSESGCKQDSATLKYENGNLYVEAVEKTECYAYFEKYKSDINLIIHVSESDTEPEKIWNSIPNLSYSFLKDQTKCKNDVTGANITPSTIIKNLDSFRNDYFDIQTSQKVTCDFYFKKVGADVELHYFIQDDTSGDILIDNIKYREVLKYSDIDLTKYNYKNIVCKNESSATHNGNGTFTITANGTDECDAYYTLK